MGKARTGIWKDFEDYLRDTRGLARTTITTYISQVRRILRDVPTISEETLVAYLDERPKHHRTPFRASWRSFAAFCHTRGVTDVPALPTKVPTVPPAGTLPGRYIPESVQAALRIMNNDGLSATVISKLTWDLDDDPRRQNAFPTKHWLRSPESVPGEFTIVERAGLAALKAWGYPDAPPAPGDPLLVKRPGATLAMPLAAIRRILRGDMPSAPR